LLVVAQAAETQAEITTLLLVVVVLEVCFIPGVKL
jgi:hypothetical protein